MKVKCLSVSVLVFLAVFVSGCAENTGLNQSTVSVFGTGTVLVRPDMVQMNISLSETAATTQLAQEEVTKMVRQALEILKTSGIEDKNISTASLRFNTEYDYGTGKRVVIGQKAEQQIAFSIPDIRDDDKKAPEIIDRLIQINGIELNQIDFDVKDSTEYFVKSRELAYQKALEKASQYAELSGLKVVKTLNITEEGAQQVLPINNRIVNQLNFAAAGFEGKARSEDASTQLPAGELEISSRILAVFLLE